MVGLISRRVNLSVHPQYAIQKRLRINTQPQLQPSASHHTLVSPTLAPHHSPDIHPQTNIFLQPREDVCPLVPIFNSSRLGPSHGKNISRYFD